MIQEIYERLNHDETMEKSVHQFISRLIDGENNCQKNNNAKNLYLVSLKAMNHYLCFTITHIIYQHENKTVFRLCFFYFYFFYSHRKHFLNAQTFINVFET